MILLTGDVHHQGLATADQRSLLPIREVEVALEFAELCSDLSVSATLYITGKCAVEDPDTLEEIGTFPNVEIGGHTWSAFQPKLLHRVFNRFGHHNGPLWFQRHQIRKTRRILQETCNAPILSWRHHAYLRDPNSYPALVAEGIESASDVVSRVVSTPYMEPEGIFQLPINCVPDHEHLYHGRRTPSWCKRWLKRYNFSDDWGCSQFTPREWAEQVLYDVEAKLAVGGTAVILAHPACQYLGDRFDSLRWLLQKLQGETLVTATELLPQINRAETLIGAKR